MKDGQETIRKSIVPIIRIAVKDSDDVLRLKGTLRISNMIPVPESELIMYDAENETDDAYRSLINSEMIFIRKNKKLIETYASIIYGQKTAPTKTASYIDNVLDFKALEQLCDTFIP